MCEWERAMGLDKKNASDWVKGLPFLLVLGVLVGTRCLPLC